MLYDIRETRGTKKYFSSSVLMHLLTPFILKVTTRGNGKEGSISKYWHIAFCAHFFVLFMAF